MKYALLCAPSEQALISQVTANLNAGWRLQGGVTVCPMNREDYTPGTLFYSQAMTKGSRLCSFVRKLLRHIRLP